MEHSLITVRSAPTHCWSCGAETVIISSISIAAGEEVVDCAVADFTDRENLLARLVASFPPDPGIGPIKLRRSATLNKTYMSNGCRHCDAIYGQHYEIHARYDETDLCTFEAPAAEGWDAMLQAILSSEDGHIFRAFE